jgi:hypothetical protein
VRAAVGCALLALMLPVDWLSLLFAAPLALFLPGYAIASAACARRAVPLPQMLTLSVGLSLATLALGSLVLNYVPGGIRAISWAVLLVLVVLAASRDAALRRGPPQTERRPLQVRIRLTRSGAALLSAGLLAVLAAMILTFTTVSAKHAVGYTELWLEPLHTLHGGAARIGVRSDEQARTRYRLKASFGDGSKRIVRAFPLNPGEARVVRLEIRRPPGAPPLRVAVSLFRQDRPALPYRRVWGWISSPTRSR